MLILILHILELFICIMVDVIRLLSSQDQVEIMYQDHHTVDVWIVYLYLLHQHLIHHQQIRQLFHQHQHHVLQLIVLVQLIQLYQVIVETILIRVLTTEGQLFRGTEHR